MTWVENVGFGFNVDIQYMYICISLTEPRYVRPIVGTSNETTKRP
jgi:hypothetical protein